MKLRNKKTGEIVECAVIPVIDGYVNEYEVFEKGESLAELNEEWEDYEDKDHYFIEMNGVISVVEALNYESDYIDNAIVPKLKQIGNYFDTREEAVKAVEKLKAWKRLKDKGFRFKTWGWEDRTGNEYCVWFMLDDDEKSSDDLNLLFGGEE